MADRGKERTMARITMASVAAVILLLAAVAGTASAYTLSLKNLNLATASGTGEIPVRLDTAPQGIAGYSITFHLSNPQAAVITGVDFPGWADTRFTSLSGTDNDVTIMLADVGDGISPTTPVPPDGGHLLATVKVKGVSKGMSSEITAIVNQMDADNGAVILPTVSKGTIDVELAPGTLYVTTTPAAAQGAFIFVDDRQVMNQATGGPAVTPFLVPDIPVGGHRVSVSLSGWLPTEKEKTVDLQTGQQKDVTFTMVRPVTISVKTTPPGASIVLDGTDTGQTTQPAGSPQPSWKVLPGLHTVAVSLTGYKGVSGSKNIAPPLLTSFTFSWTLVPATNCITGRIYVNSVPEGAAISIDGEPIDAETPGFVDACPGDHQVSVALEGYDPPDPVTKTVTEGGTADVTFELTEKPPVPVPEFPTVLVPFLSLIGLILAVVLIRARKGS